MIEIQPVPIDVRTLIRVSTSLAERRFALNSSTSMSG